ncbi:carboxypeptidase B-like [Epargyreus clarus]|uniref:carboxypeptidase B-like n=1 Tax=Epargyreus clarus TaxID=520877 RepID=UPI003C2ADB73
MKSLVLVLLVAAACAKHEDYIGWKTYFVGPSTTDQFKDLAVMVPVFELDFLSRPIIGREGLVLVKPEHQDSFTKALEEKGITYYIHADNIKERLDIDDEAIEAQNKLTMSRSGFRKPFDNYQPLEVYDNYLEDIARRFPNIATLVTPANSFEGHPIKYLKISTTDFQDRRKPVIVIDGGIHSREWISPPTVAYAIRKLTEDLTETEMLHNYDWILLPIVNPDGYKFSFERARFWRKTRSTDHAQGQNCPGVDGNRNYDFFWNTVGSSSWPCHDTFAGSRPFSEVETRVVRDILHEHLERITLYITMHSFGSLILYSWGHNGSFSHNAFALHVVGVNMADAIFNATLPHFPRYTVGNAGLSPVLLASGAAEDYAHYIGVPLSYTFELPGVFTSGTGFGGFTIHPRYIEQVCKETWAAIAVGARRSAEMFGKK